MTVVERQDICLDAQGFGVERAIENETAHGFYDIQCTHIVLQNLQIHNFESLQAIFTKEN